MKSIVIIILRLYSLKILFMEELKSVPVIMSLVLKLEKYHKKILLLVCALFFVINYTFAENITNHQYNTTTPKLQIARLTTRPPIYRSYSNGLISLLSEMNSITTMTFDTQSVFIKSFETKDIFQYPLIYVNYIDREDWTLSSLERRNLKEYLDRGGFLFIDAGINAEFLRKEKRHGQHHSFANWKITPTLEKEFEKIYPNAKFKPLKNSHKIFKTFYHGLPDPEILPDSVKNFVVNEKWPDGTYSVLALYINDRIAAIATPIVAMGWGKNAMGQWSTRISFRIREGEKGLSSSLKNASYSGERFETVRKDGRKDIIYCQSTARPAWAEEADGNWRLFKYYESKEISDYAHQYFTRLGINIITYALTN